MSNAPDFAAIYRAEAHAVLATLIRLLGGFELAEEGLHDAWLAALDQWPRDGLPKNPRAWLVSAGRFKAIDKLRRKARFDAAQDELTRQIEATADAGEAMEDHAIADDQLRLIFTCCHPALSPDAQVALTLREICGLTTEEIAAAYLTTAPTIAQRIVRAKAKIRDARIPYEVPAPAELSDRLEAVLHVIYLVFNEGYSASSGASATRTDLCAEAIRLVRLLAQLQPDPETTGLLALMLLHDARRDARTTPTGELVLLSDQDHALWNQAQIAEGIALVHGVLAGGRVGAYALQAAIVAEHAKTSTAADTNWTQIVAYYDLLLRLEATPVVELNRAVAISLRDGPAAGLPLVDAILASGELDDYRLAHASRADMLRRLDRRDEARAAYQQALALSRQEPERRFLQTRIDALTP